MKTKSRATPKNVPEPQKPEPQKPEPPKKPKKPAKAPAKAPKKEAAKPKEKPKAKTKALVAPSVTKKSKPIERDFNQLAIVFDTETTGLIQNRKIELNRQPEIVELYACVVDLTDGHVVEEYESFFRPSKPMEPDVIAIHGITNEMVADAPKFKDNAKEIIEFFRKAPIVIAHNLKFDVDMVEIEMERCGKVLDWPRKLCTVEQTMHMKGYRLNLSALHEELFGEKFAGAHRAKVDVMALVRCCVQLRKEDLV